MLQYKKQWLIFILLLFGIQNIKSQDFHRCQTAEYEQFLIMQEPILAIESRLI